VGPKTSHEGERERAFDEIVFEVKGAKWRDFKAVALSFLRNSKTKY
jgi:hypothetical protein